MGKGKAQTTVKFHPNYKQLKENMQAVAKNPYVKIGVLGDKADEPKTDHDGNETPGALTVAEVATFHEFGTVNIPQRSFLRGTLDAHRSEFNQATVSIFKKITRGEINVEKGLRILGELIQSKVVARIRAGISPALKQSTIDRKGSSKPLIDTGQLVQSIRYSVEDKS